MKSLTLFILVCMAWALPIQCQTKPNFYIQDAYSSNLIEGMSQNRIEYLNYLSLHAWVIEDVPEGKQAANYPLLYKIDHETKQTLDGYFSCTEINSFNILRYRFSIKKERNHYKIAGCEKWLIIKSHDEITKGFNEFRNN